MYYIYIYYIAQLEPIKYLRLRFVQKQLSVNHFRKIHLACLIGSSYVTDQQIICYVHSILTSTGSIF